MRFMRFKCLCNPGLFAFICAGIVMLSCGGCAAGFRVENDEMDEDIVEAYSVLTEIEDGAGAIEKGYLDDDGFVDPEQMDGLLEEINGYAASLYEEGIITDYHYQSGDTCVYMEIDGWLGCLYDPPLDGVLSGGSEKPQIVTLESVHAPLMFALAGFRGPDDTARMIEEKDPSFTFSANYDKDEVTIETIQSLPQNSIIIWAGHGAYDSKYGPALCLGSMVDGSDYQSMMQLHREEFQEKAVLSTTNGGFCVTPKFFEQYMPKNALYGDVVYLGTCSSYYCATYDGYEDSRLVDSILGLGASVVLGNTYVVSPIYSYKMTDSFFEGLAEPMDDGALRTVEEALTYAKEKNGKEDAINKSEVFAKCAEGKEDFRLSDMPQNAQIEDTNQTYSECTVQGYYPGGWDCSIMFSEAMIEERTVMVREYGSGAGSDGKPLAGYEKSSVTFISLAPGSRVTVPPNTHDKPYYGEDEYYDPDDPYYSQAICEGAGEFTDKDHYELEWFGSVDGFFSGTAEEIIPWDDHYLALATDQFDTDYCFIRLGREGGGSADGNAPDNAKAEIVDSGECGDMGDNVIWTLYSDGTLDISGSGETDNNTFDSDFMVGWLKNDQYEIKRVTIQDGVTLIAWESFVCCEELESISLPTSVRSIESGAFDRCDSLSDVYYSGTKAQWEMIDINTVLDLNAPLLNAVTHCSDGIIPPKGIVPAGNRCGDNLTWDLGNDGTLTIQGTGEMWGFAISTPPPWWEEGNESIERVILKDGVTSIGSDAFGCYDGTVNLTSVTIPSTVTKIHEDAFALCDRLKDVYYSGTGVQWDQIQIYNEWNGNDSLLNATIHYNGSGLGRPADGKCGENLTWELDNGVLTVSGTGEMWGLEYMDIEEVPWHEDKAAIKKVMLENGVTTVGKWAFCDCANLTSVAIPDTVDSIEPSAFAGCSSLKNVKIPNSDAYICEWAFAECSSLTSITLSKSSEWVDKGSFANCESLTSIVIPENVTSIGRFAFSGCSNLKSVTIPVSVTYMDEFAFGDCDKLTDVYYSGTKEQWETIKFESCDDGNAGLLNAIIHYNSTGP